MLTCKEGLSSGVTENFKLLQPCKVKPSETPSCKMKLGEIITEISLI